MATVYISNTDVSGSGHPIAQNLTATRIDTAIEQVEDEADKFFAELGLSTPIAEADRDDALKAGIITLTLARLMADYGVPEKRRKAKEDEGWRTLRKFAEGLKEQKQRAAEAMVTGRGRVTRYTVNGDEVGNETTETFDTY